LLEMPPSLGSRGAHHLLAVRAIDPESRRPADALSQQGEIRFTVALAQVDREHAPVGVTAERGVLGVVIEHEQVTRRGLQRDRRHVAPMTPQPVLALAEMTFLL